MPYPVRHVFVVIAELTIVSLGLYDLLRPMPDGSTLPRTARAALASFVTLVWIAMTRRTDQPGYAYVDGTYVVVVTGLLVLGLTAQATLAVVRTLDRRRHAA